MGAFDQGQAYLERLLEAMRLTAPGPTFEYAFPAFLIPVVAYTTDVEDRFEVAEAAAEAVLSSPSAVPLLTMYARAGLALIAVRRGDIESAGKQYAALETSQGTMMPGFAIAIDRLLGLLSVTQGRLDQAIAHFEDALAFGRKSGYRPEVAWSCCDYADTLLQRNEPGDREKAVSLLDESLTISTELGMRPLMERVLSRREILRA